MNVSGAVGAYLEREKFPSLLLASASRDALQRDDRQVSEALDEYLEFFQTARNGQRVGLVEIQR